MTKPDPRKLKRKRLAAQQTSLKILTAAETLFAQRGIEAVSLREIAAAAGQLNSNAAQYHFGTKENLVQAIFRFRVAAMSGERERMLATAEARGRLQDARTLLEIFYLPYLDLINAEGKHSYAAFVSQYLVRYRPLGMLHFADRESSETRSIRRLIELLRRRISHVPPDVADNRIDFASVAFTNMLIAYDNEKRRSTSNVPFVELIDDTLQMMEAAFCAPYRPHVRDLQAFKNDLDARKRGMPMDAADGQPAAVFSSRSLV